MNKNTIRVSLILFLVALPLLFVFQNCGKMSTVDSSSIDGDPFPEPPVDLGVPNKDFESISTGSSHACGITQQEKVKCWGGNDRGQLGNGNKINSSAPVEVPNLIGVLQVVAGGNFTCALVVGGEVKCWGDNQSGQLGNNSITISGENALSLIPVDVLGLTGVQSIAAGSSFACALTSETVKCWGDNQNGQLGNGTISANSTNFVGVVGLTNVREIATGNQHACALLNSGGVKCWGYNQTGQLGNGNTIVSTRPIDVLNLNSVQQISLGSDHTCARLNSGIVKCWGRHHVNGSLYDNSSPVEVAGLTGVQEVAADMYHTCARLTNGTVKCWGNYNPNDMTSGSSINTQIPVVINGLANVKQITAGYYYTCSLLINNSVKCWGLNTVGQLGNGFATNSSDSVISANQEEILQLSFSENHTCAVVTGGTVKCWGYNGNGQLGIGVPVIYSIAPTNVVDLSNVQQVATSLSSTCALLTTGTVKCWGNNTAKELGNGSSSNSRIPVDVVGLTGVQKIVGGAFHYCAIISGGTVKCWGSNSYGQTGGGTQSDSTPVVTVIGLTNVQEIVAGFYHTCALVAGGTVKCFGSNQVGQLGNSSIPTIDSSTAFSLTPVDVQGLTGVEQITSNGRTFNCARLTVGTVKCWGINNYGQLGNSGVPATGLTNFTSTPVEVIGLSGVHQIASGYRHSCAKLESGEVKCWGNNSNGQLGHTNRDGTTEINAVTSSLAGPGTLVLGGYSSGILNSGMFNRVGIINPYVITPSLLLKFE